MSTSEGLLATIALAELLVILGLAYLQYQVLRDSVIASRLWRGDLPQREISLPPVAIPFEGEERQEEVSGEDALAKESEMSDAVTGVQGALGELRRRG